MKILLLQSGRPENSRQAAAVLDTLISRDIACVTMNEKRFRKCADKIRRGDYNAVVAFDAVTAGKLSALKQKCGCAFETILLCSDYCCTRQTAESGCDSYIISHKELLFEFVTRGIRDSQLLPFGVPTGVDSQRLTKEEARQKLGMNPEKQNILYMLSGMKVKRAAEVLKASVELGGTGFQHVALCGKKRSEKRLSYRFSSMADVFIDSGADPFDLYIDACDAVVTIPDPVVVTAAVQLRKPVVLLGGQGMAERMTVRFFCDRGMAFGGRTFEDCVSYAHRLCSSARLRQNMTEAQHKYIDTGAQTRIGDYFAGHF